jgi:phosphate transport system protein
MNVRTPHLDQQHHAAIQNLTLSLLRTGLRAEGMLRDAVRAVLDRDLALARSVVAVERELDLLETETDQLCLRLLARGIVEGDEVRLVTCALKADIDMERIGDLAVNIAKRALEMGVSPGLEPIPEMEQLANGTLDIVHRAVLALRDRDAAAARRIRADDTRIDALNKAVFSRMIEVARHAPDQLERAVAYTSVARHLERIADHACAIAEMVVFVVEGDWIRHTAR